jgi:transposase-like protein
MNKAQATVRMDTVQTNSLLEAQLRTAAQEMLVVALRVEADAYITQARSARDGEGRQQVVGNGLSQERTIHTSIGTMHVRQPRVHDRRNGYHYTSALLPPYVRRTMQIDAMVATLYLHGVSTTRMEEVLRSIVGDHFESMSPAVVTGIIERWQTMYQEWSTRAITKRYVYLWVDGIYTKVRTTNDRPCMLVVIGCDEDGEKELLAVVDGERESELSWTAVLTDLKQRGLRAPSLAIGDGALGFWNAVDKVYPSTKLQGCTVHALRNALDKLPKKLHEQAKEMLHKVFTADAHSDARKAFDRYKATFIDKYPKAVETIEHRLDMFLTFFTFPAAHWKSIRSTNVIESTFATIRRRSRQTNGHGSREAALAMMFALASHAQKTWRKLDGFNHIANVLDGIAYNNGIMKEAV